VESRFEPGDWLKAIGGILFLAASLLPWWRVEYPTGFDVTTNARDYVLTGVVPCVIFVVIAVLTIIIQTRQLPLPLWILHPVPVLVGTVVGTVLVGIRFFWDGYADGSTGDGDIVRGLGLYLAAAAAVIVLIGAIIGFREYDAEPEEDDVDDGDDDDDMFTDRIRRPAGPPIP
jgi:hypothetical protein